jgi:hypothetical protein
VNIESGLEGAVALLARADLPNLEALDPDQTAWASSANAAATRLAGGVSIQSSDSSSPRLTWWIRAASDDPVPGYSATEVPGSLCTITCRRVQANPKSRGSDVHAEMLDGVGFRSECQAADSRVNAIAPSGSVYASLLCTDAPSHP